MAALRRELEKRSKAELINMILKEQADANMQQRNNKKKQREFDWDKYDSQYVALKFFYLGWDYHGFAQQTDRFNTIEEHMFRALKTAKLIPECGPEETSKDYLERLNYDRCGRTDIGVSAFAQTISIKLRSINPKERSNPAPLPQATEEETKQEEEVEEVPPPSGENEKKKKKKKKKAKPQIIKLANPLDYATRLNGLLPPEIKVYGAAFVPESFSARHNCTSRQYKYYFLKENLDIPRMEEAGRLLIGEHDYRNFCKVDPTNAVHFVRKILDFSIEEVNGNEENAEKLYYFRITGRAFLWHQIRCIVEILFLIGNHFEPPEIISHLLDVNACPRKPFYNLAPDLPLCLWDCSFLNLDFSYFPGALYSIRESLYDMWRDYSVKAAMSKQMLDAITTGMPVTPLEGENQFANLEEYEKSLPKKKDSNYVPLNKRAASLSLDEKIQNLSTKKRKIFEEKTVKSQQNKRQKTD